jgi:hypothetical protein
VLAERPERAGFRRRGEALVQVHKELTARGARALIHAYKESYDELISRRTVQRLIKGAGYSWRKARRILASPDPNYDEKLEVILKTLMSLTESELFFFLDEWDPVQVRKRGGKAYSAKYDDPRIPRPQISKGTATLVAVECYH